MDCHPDLEQVIAWNHPMLKAEGKYVFGVSAAKNHLLIAPFQPAVLEDMSDQLSGYEVQKRTVRVPVDWDVDVELLCEMVGRCLPRD